MSGRAWSLWVSLGLVELGFPLYALNETARMTDGTASQQAQAQDGTADHKENQSRNIITAPPTSQKQYRRLREQTPPGVVSQGSILNYVYDDVLFSSATNFQGFPISRSPLYALKQRDKYGDLALVFGGNIQMVGSYFWGDKLGPKQVSIATGNYRYGYNINVTTASLDALVNINHWIQTKWEINSKDMGDPFLKNAFITIGNLDESPFFVTLGKNRPALGTFNGGGPWIAGITQGYFRPSYLTNILGGYSKGALNANVMLISPQKNRSMDDDFQNDKISAAYSLFYSDQIPESPLIYQLEGSFLWGTAHMGMGADEVYNRNFDASQPVSGSNTPSKQSNATNAMVNFEGTLGTENLGLGSGITSLTHKQVATNNSIGGAWYVQGTWNPSIYQQRGTLGLSYGQAYNMTNTFFPLGGLAGFGPSVRGVQREVVAFVQRPFFNPVILAGLEYSWLGLYNKHQTSEVSLTLSAYF